MANEDVEREARIEARRGARRRRAAVARPVETDLEFYENARWRWLANAVWWLILLAAIIVIYLRGNQVSDTFLVEDNVNDMLRQMLVPALLVPAMVMIIAAGGLDLSVGAVAAFTGTLFAWLLDSESASQAPYIALGVAAGIGLVNGLVIVITRIHAALVTLAMMVALPGAIVVLRRIHGVAADASRLGVVSRFGLLSPASWIGLAAVGVVAFVLMEFTPFGRRPRPDAAREREPSGARGFYAIVPYILSGLSAGFLGLVLLAESGPAMRVSIQEAPGLAANPVVLVVLAAMVGGAPFGGGHGSVIGGLLAIIALTLGAKLCEVSGVYLPVLALQGGALVVGGLVVRLYYGLYSVSFRRSTSG